MVQISESTFLSADGKTQIFYREYLPEGEARAIVQLAHGIAEYIDRYDAFARFLAEHGYIVVANDHLGHGRSLASPEDLGFFSEERGWVNAVEDMHILHDRTAARFPGKMYFLFGHSMGSFLTRTYIIRYKSGLDGVILSGTGHLNRTLIRSGTAVARTIARMRGLRYKSKTVDRLAFGSYNNAIKPRRSPFDWLSRDEAAVDAYEADPLCGWLPSVGLFLDMMGGLSFITQQKNIDRMNKNLPIHFMSGDCDPVGDMGKGVVRAYNCFRKAGMRDVSICLYPGSRHEILNEVNRREVFEDVLAWLNIKTGV